MIDARGIDHRVKDVVSRVFGLDPSEIEPDFGPATHGEWTSLLHMTLMVALEDEFDVRLTMEEMASMTTVAAITDVLGRYSV